MEKINMEMLTGRMDSVIRFFLYILIFWLPYSPAVVESCVIVSFLLWVIKRCLGYDYRRLKMLSLREKIRSAVSAFSPKPTFLNKPIAFFLLIGMASVVLSVYPAQSLRGFLTKTLEWFVVYFLVMETMVARKHIWIVLGIFLFSAFATSLDGIAQFYFTHRDIFRARVIPLDSGATAAFNTYNTLGGYLTFPAVFSLSLLFLQGGRKLKYIFFLPVFVIMLWCLWATLSRGAWVGAGTGTLFALFLFLKRRWWIMITGTICILVIGALIFTPSSLKEKIRLGSKSATNVNWRCWVWQRSLKMISERPLFGYGLNTYMKFFKEYRREMSDRDNFIFVDENPSYAHNCFIQIASEMGLLGLSGFLWMITRLFWSTIEVITGATADKYNLSIVAAGVLAGALAFLVHSFVDTHFYSLQLSVLFWFMAGVLASICRLIDVRKTECALVTS